jgi:hypothetical protein
MNGTDGKHDGPKLIPRGTPKWILGLCGVTVGALVPLVTALLPPVNEYIKGNNAARFQQLKLETELESQKAANEATALGTILQMVDTLRTALATEQAQNRTLTEALETCKKKKGG